MDWLLSWYYIIIRLDISLFYEINHFRCLFLDYMMPYITDFDNWIPLVIVIIAALLIKGNQKERIAVLGIAIVILMADQIASGILKPMFKRPRPCAALHDVIAWKIKSTNSFPSSHAANSAGVATYCIIKYPKLTPVLILFAVTISWSRIYLGYHYPLDILVGMMIGIYSGVFIYLVEKIILKYIFKKNRVASNKK